MHKYPAFRTPDNLEESPQPTISTRFYQLNQESQKEDQTKELNDILQDLVSKNDELDDKKEVEELILELNQLSKLNPVVIPKSFNEKVRKFKEKYKAHKPADKTKLNLLKSKIDQRKTRKERSTKREKSVTKNEREVNKLENEDTKEYDITTSM